MPLTKRERIGSRTWGVAAVATVMLLGGCGQFSPQQDGAQQPSKETMTVAQPAPQEDSGSSSEQSSEESAEQASEESTGQESEVATEEFSQAPEAEDGLIRGAEALQVRLDPESTTKA